MKPLGDVLKAGAGEARNLAEATEVLLRIQEDSVPDNHQFSLPMRLLLKPLRKRFKYHFLGSKVRNNRLVYCFMTVVSGEVLLITFKFLQSKFSAAICGKATKVEIWPDRVGTMDGIPSSSEVGTSGSTYRR